MRNKLIEKRNKIKLTQADVAKELDITRAFYDHIETGKRNPTLKLAKKLQTFMEKMLICFFIKGNETYPNDKNCAWKGENGCPR